jgi:PLP dependent protein
VSPAAVPDSFAERLARVRERIERASAEPRSVRLVAVTKGFGADAVRDALHAGVNEVGENYANELLAKADELGPAGSPAVRPAPLWHFLGAVQRNKVARLAPLVGCWQSVSRVEEGRAIARHRPGATVLVQLDIAGLPGRGGCDPDRASELVAALAGEDLGVAGLMAVGVPGPPEASRSGFRLLSSLADRLDLPVRSMGMTDDLEVALSEGSTMVRIGRALFGDRPSAGPAPR